MLLLLSNEGSGEWQCDKASKYLHISYYSDIAMMVPFLLDVYIIAKYYSSSTNAVSRKLSIHNCDFASFSFSLVRELKVNQK